MTKKTNEKVSKSVKAWGLKDKQGIWAFALYKNCLRERKCPDDRYIRVLITEITKNS